MEGAWEGVRWPAVGIHEEAAGLHVQGGLGVGVANIEALVKD